MHPLRTRWRQRGAATVELALVAPLFVTLILLSMYVTELLQARFKAQEAARYIAWEMTSYTLTDFARKEHDEAFALAREQALEEAKERYQDLDGVDEKSPAGFAVRFEDFKLDVQNRRADMVETGLVEQAVQGLGAEGFVDRLAGVINGGLAATVGYLGFNPAGKAEARVEVTVRNALLPRSFLEGEGGWFQTSFSRFDRLTFRSGHTLVASGWHLPDGSDAVVRGNRAGSHTSGSGPEAEHGLHRQVARMTYLGVCDRMVDVPGLGPILNFLGRALPFAPCGTFVVSHNYRPLGDGGGPGVDACTQSPGYPEDARAGLNNVDATASLDWPRPRCYDTAPFRDTWQYEESEYLKVFRARGPHFMGCEQPMADNPAERRTQYKKDENDMPLNCLDGDDAT